MYFVNIKNGLIAAALLLLMGSAAQASTLWVNCGGKGGFTSIGAALKVLQFQFAGGPNTINVSGGTLDVISIFDSRDVAINGFTINAGAGPNANGISCNDYSVCRLSSNLIQGAGNGGFAVFQQSLATLDGDTLQNNGTGLLVRSGSGVRSGGQSRPVIARTNGLGIDIGRQAFTNLTVVIENNLGVGAQARFNSTMDLTGPISGNGSVGVYIRESSAARLNGTVAGNTGPGVQIEDLSMVTFLGGTVSGNGGTDVLCNPQYSVTRGVAGTGGTTNCVEP
jgi:hypothetical protein